MARCTSLSLARPTRVPRRAVTRGHALDSGFAKVVVVIAPIILVILALAALAVLRALAAKAWSLPVVWRNFARLVCSHAGTRSLVPEPVFIRAATSSTLIQAAPERVRRVGGSRVVDRTPARLALL